MTDERWSTLPVMPEVITPAQFADLSRRQDRQPELRMRVELLQGAIADYGNGQLLQTTRAQNLAREAWLWIFTGRPAPLSFIDVCESLGINADQLRKALLTWKPTAKVKPERHEVARGVQLKSNFLAYKPGLDANRVRIKPGPKVAA